MSYGTKVNSILPLIETAFHKKAVSFISQKEVETVRESELYALSGPGDRS